MPLIRGNFAMKPWAFVVALVIIAAVLCFCRDSSRATESATPDSDAGEAELMTASRPAYQATTDPYIVVRKADRRLELHSATALLGTYRIALGNSPVGSKIREGDGRTPEGRYYVCTKKFNSKYYRSLGISYPGLNDAERGLRDKMITQKEFDDIRAAIEDRVCPPWNTALGGAVCIHGNGSSADWTLGCVAMDNADMDTLFERVAAGTDVIVMP